MPRGWHGAYLRIDLSRGTAVPVPLPPEVLSAFVGGIGLGTWICLREGGADHDPLRPEAPLVFALSPLVGTPLTTSAKLAVVARSPLTGRLCDAVSSSHFAIAAKRAGFDAYALVGQAAEWSRAIVDEGNFSLQPAPELVGRAAADCELEGYRTAAIGPAGEHLVRYATISNDRRHAGRGGLGAVMGSKRLKALSLRGTRRVSVADPDAVLRSAQELSRKSFGPATAKYRELGTIANVLTFNRLDTLPTRNFQEGTFEGAGQLSAEELHALHEHARESCAACTIGCEHIFKTRSGQPVRLEYESLFALGSLLGIEDRDSVLEAVRLCDRLGLDTISVGGTIAFAMEAGLDGLAFGDTDAVPQLLQDIATRRGLGDLLAEGSRRAAAHSGRPELAMHVKGLEMPGYDPRALQAMGLGLAVNTRGADHNRSGAYELDFSAEGDRGDFRDEDAAKVVAIEDRAAAMDSLILCKFLRGVFGDFEAEGAELLRQVCGVEVDLRALGARVCNLRKLFNIRAGWVPAEDTLPSRLLEPPLSAGKLASMIGSYYQARGWAPDGRPEPPTLKALGLEELACPSP